MGFAFRGQYHYADKYLAEFSGRYDGSYKFFGNVGGKRWGFFPSVSLGWRISEEEFFSSLRGAVDNLKLRASFGSLGDDAGSSAYAYLSTYGIMGREAATTKFDYSIILNSTILSYILFFIVVSVLMYILIDRRKKENNLKLWKRVAIKITLLVLLLIVGMNLANKYYFSDEFYQKTKNDKNFQNAKIGRAHV